MSIRIRKRLDSETLVLPELRPFIGREVEITVVADPAPPAESLPPRPTTPVHEADPSPEARRRLSEELQRSFDRLGRPMGPRTWTRDDLYER